MTALSLAPYQSTGQYALAGTAVLAVLLLSGAYLVLHAGGYRGPHGVWNPQFRVGRTVGQTRAARCGKGSDARQWCALVTGPGKPQVAGRVGPAPAFGWLSVGGQRWVNGQIGEQGLDLVARNLRCPRGVRMDPMRAADAHRVTISGSTLNIRATSPGVSSRCGFSKITVFQFGGRIARRRRSQLSCGDHPRWVSTHRQALPTSRASLRGVPTHGAHSRPRDASGIPILRHATAAMDSSRNNRVPAGWCE